MAGGTAKIAGWYDRAARQRVKSERHRAERGEDRVIRALCSYFLAWVYNGYKGFSGYNRIQLMMLDDRKVPKWRQQKISQR